MTTHDTARGFLRQGKSDSVAPKDGTVASAKILMMMMPLLRERSPRDKIRYAARRPQSALKCTTPW